MASNLSFVQFVCEQIGKPSAITFKKMFGDYAIYCYGKIIGLVCDNQFFIKKTPINSWFITQLQEAVPYPGAKFYFLVSQIDDKDFVRQLVEATYENLIADETKKRRL